jgi:hypothetical protein
MSVSAEQMLARDLEVINEMTTAVTSTLDLAEIVRIALSRIKLLASAEAISLLRYDAERDELVFAATETLRESAFYDAPARSGGLASWVARRAAGARDRPGRRSAVRRHGGAVRPPCAPSPRCRSGATDGWSACSTGRSLRRPAVHGSRRAALLAVAESVRSAVIRNASA